MSSSMADHEVEMATALAASTNATSEIKKRKTMKERSDVWEHFDKFIDAAGMSKSRCKYCSKEYKSDSKTCGTITLKTHLLKCSKYPFNYDLTGADPAALFYEAIQTCIASNSVLHLSLS
ncbi:Zinc finger, BED-type [Dillenia turbinata]|uniref:Zinc finger, BED-type n=1 Tax=Dillenia turbinata TaxID=194707 RepID=A0AAN8YXN1_9MAGN